MHALYPVHSYTFYMAYRNLFHFINTPQRIKNDMLKFGLSTLQGEHNFLENICEYAKKTCQGTRIKKEMKILSDP